MGEMSEQIYIDKRYDYMKPCNISNKCPFTESFYTYCRKILETDSNIEIHDRYVYFLTFYLHQY